MKRKKEKPTTFEKATAIANLIIEALIAIAALITAVKWW